MRHNPSIEALSHLKQSIWKCKAKLSYCEIWENTQCQLIAEAYPMWNGNGSRSHNSLKLPYVVECMGTIGTEQKYLLMERIPNRLSQVEMINQTQSLKVLYATFKAMSNLQPLFGFFTLTQSCICFNHLGQVKIWVHPNLSLVRPLKIYAPQQNITNKIISQTIQLVENKCFNPMLFYGLKRKIEERQNYSFESAAEYINNLAQSLFIDLRQPKQKNYEKKLTNQYSNRNILSKAYFKQTSQQSKEFLDKKQFQLFVHGSSDQNQPLNTEYKSQDKQQHKRNKSTADNPQIFKKSGDIGNFYAGLFLERQQKSQNNSVRNSYFNSYHQVASQSPNNITKNAEKSHSPAYLQRQNTYSKDKNRNKQKKNENFQSSNQNQTFNKQEVYDSFCKSIGVTAMDNKKAGEKDFQTFGNLEQCSNPSSQHQMSKNTYGDLDIAEMDAKIQKKLSCKDPARRQVRRPSLQQNTPNFQNMKDQLIQFMPTYQKSKQNNNPSIFLQQKKQQQNKLGKLVNKQCEYLQKKYQFLKAPEHKKSTSIYYTNVFQQKDPNTPSAGSRVLRKTANQGNLFRYNIDSRPYMTRR